MRVSFFVDGIWGMVFSEVVLDDGENGPSQVIVLLRVRIAQYCGQFEMRLSLVRHKFMISLRKLSLTGR